MVDSVNANGGVKSLITSRDNPVLERRERKTEDVRSDQVRAQDRLELSQEAQNLAQVEDTARLARQQLETSNESLSGGRVFDESV